MTWLLPFAICSAIALGALVALSIDALVAGRFGVSGVVWWPLFDIGIRLIVGFLLAIIATGISKFRRRAAPIRIPLRLGLALAAGVVAAVALGPGSDPSPLTLSLSVYFPALIAWPWGSPKEPPPPAKVVSDGTKWHQACPLPFLISIGMAFGSLVGFPIAAGDALERDPVGSMGALVLIITAAAGFFLSGIGLTAAYLLRRPAPEGHGVRLLISAVACALIGAAAWALQQGPAAVLSLVGLLVAPIALAWPWRRISGPTSS